ncbi:LysE family translocator [Roseovarius pacificus]|uniref:LysE family translocator n=1 Tax=Roseovarius pacificus TaxID=337701 RepID=UPI002A18C861|nr:LysE family translocator [Roseovarius pacificus]
MSESLNLVLILGAAFIGVASPGPGTLAIAGASMRTGRRRGLALASGMTTGSFILGTLAALGLGALLAANQVFLEVFRYVGSGYLLFLALRSLRSMLSSETSDLSGSTLNSLRSAYFTGLGIHLTNPKAILFFSALYAIGIPADVTATELAVVVISVTLQTMFILHSYALLLSKPSVIKIYIGARKWFEGIFAFTFGLAGLRILLSKLN